MTDWKTHYSLITSKILTEYFSFTSTSTSSPWCCPKRACAIGEKLEILLLKGSASIELTIWKVWISPLSTFSRLTFEPIETLLDPKSALIIFALEIIVSNSRIRDSIIPCFSRATSYSAFSERSPCERASLISWITFTRSTLIKCSSSFSISSSFCWVKRILSLTVFFILYSFFGGSH
ncbi:hypothetical protein mhp689 [Mesomycoplasma hyopneumoniae 232]|uniref:Uncharacterized protein n=1 Tax=Mesomycoplasma hyopneumoniae (strain 232) TaxID=295358 RepID=Q5ZZL9_MESH2|nr:hypothetical protein mhp689 [Mesomycoplasma hyopneumoniae 232]